MIIKALAIAVCGVFVSLIIKDKNPHGAMAVSISVCAAILWEIIPEISSIYKKTQRYISVLGTDEVIFTQLIKVVVIALVTRLAAEMCRDNGEKAIGAKIELAGTAAGMMCALPVLDKALSIIGAL